VYPIYSVFDTMTVCASELPYSWNDSIFTAAGTKVTTLKTVHSCDSVVTMTLKVGDYTRVTIYKDICDGDSYSFDGKLLTVTGTYYDTVPRIGACDSITELYLTVNPIGHTSVTVDTCDWYEWNGTTYTISGDYTFSHLDAHGCTQVDTLHLTLGKSNTGDTIAFANYSFDWYEHVGITTSGDYTHTFTNVSGCDSVVTLHLTLNITTYGDTTAVVCDSFAWHGVTYTSTPLIAPKYTIVGGNQYGCDSVVTLLLTVNKSTTSDTIATVCDSIKWYGVTYTASGDYIHTLTNAVGCDSVRTLHLTVNKSTTGIDEHIVCDSLRWIDGNLYTASTNTPTFMLTNAAGCDSLVTLHLTVNKSYNQSENLVICQNDLPYSWRDTIFQTGSVTGNYVFHRHTVHGCDSTVTLHLVVNSVINMTVLDTVCDDAFPYTWRDTTFLYGTVSGDYVFHRVSVSGCDSIVTLSLTIGHNSVSVTAATDEICNNDGTITVSSTGKNPVQYSLDGITFQSSNIFKNLGDKSYTITAKDANGCMATTSVTIAPAVIPTLSITCPPDVYDTLNFGESVIKIAPDVLGTPTASHSLSWPFSIANNAPSDSLYAEGMKEVTWVMTDSVCGYKESCKQRVFIAFPTCPDAVDCEGHVYHGVRIGCDCWTQRNLESTLYSDCSAIPCVYNYESESHPNVVENVNIYGRLYCYSAAIRDSADNGHGHIQGICPAGWYLPTPEKYMELNTYGAFALKSPLYWIPYGGDNSTGFTALPAGFYNGGHNRYEGLLGETYFWSTKNTGPATVVSVFESLLDCDVLIEFQPQPTDGYSVRCIKEKE